MKYEEYYIRNINEVLGWGVQLHGCLMLHALKRISQLQSPGQPVPELPESAQCPQKPLWCAAPLLQTHKYLPEPFTGDSSWHFGSSQRAVRRASNQAVFGGCRLCCQWWWCNTYCGSTPSTCLHGRTWARWWKSSQPVSCYQGMCYGQPCSGTKRAVLPSTTILLCGLRPLYVLLLYFMRIRDF